MERVGKITSEMAQLQEQKNEALRMKLRGEVDLPTYRTVTRELDAAHDQLAREHKPDQRSGDAGAARPIAGVGGPICY